MKNKLNILKCFILIIISAFTLSGCSLMDILFPTDEVEKFSFSGYVFADNVALPQAKVSCGVTETVTDERGFYSFSGLTKVVQVQVSKEGYFFDDSLVYVKSNRNDVNFEGNEYFEISGIVKNGDVNVVGAEVTIVSNAGTYKSVTNNLGNFYFSNIAGKASVSAKFEDVSFFTKEIDKESEFVTINSAINITGKIVCDEEATAQDFNLKLNDEIVKDAIKVKEGKLFFNLNNVVPNSVVKLESENYFVENDTIIVTDENEISFNCEKFYSVSVEAISGETKLQNAIVTKNGEVVAETKVDGKYVLNNLHGENVFGATLNGFVFENKISNAKNTEIKLIGKFNLQINVATDNNQFENIKIFVNENCVDVLNSSLVFNEVELNSIVTVLTDDYYISNSVIEIESLEPVTINLFKFYSLNLLATFNGNALPQTNVTINGEAYELNTNGELVVDNLYGENLLELSLNGYKFDSYIINFNTNIINAVAKKLFNLNGKVLSGNLLIENAKVEINGLETLTNANGEFSFENLFEDGNIVVTKQGYNVAEIHFNVDGEYVEINLTYNVTGKVMCGDNLVSGVKVSCGDITSITEEEGTFTLQNLQGEAEIVFEKEYYNIQSIKTTFGEDVIANATFYIVGLVTDSTGNPIDNLLIILSDVINNETQTVYTNNGNYEFNNLTSEYLLTYEEVDFTLKPNYHTVTVGGEYNFSNSGYGFSGRVMCGNNAVSNVLITAGDKTTYTDAQGYYTFALITKETTLTLYKKGYTFNNNNLNISDVYDGRDDVNFTCSYSILGKIISGNTPIENAKVSINGREALSDNNGNYEIDNLEGNGNIEISKQGYTFIGETFVDGYNTFNFKAYYTAVYKVVTGTISVKGVQVTLNDDVYTTDENGIIEIDNAEIGFIITLSKQGYNFTNVTLNGYEENPVEINCSYNVTGVVYSGTEVVENCLVTVGNLNVVTNASGEFSFNGLVGENIITYSLENFQFEDSLVKAPINLEVYAKYSVTGVVKVGETFLSNVTVTAGKFTTTTNGAGRFEISGLTTRVTIVLEKEGYEFEGNFEVNSPCNLEFFATYSICGYVTSGSAGVEGVLVTSSLGGKGIETNIDGFYKITGQTGIVTLTFEKDGYKTHTSQEINGYINNLNINLSYSVVINFSGVEDFSGIYISVNGVRKEYSARTVTISDLTGTNNLKFSKTGYSLTPSEYGVEGYTVINITIVRYYEANFIVKTDNDIMIDDVTLQVGTKQAQSLGNGKYIASELSGKINVFVDLSVKDSSGNSIYSKRIAGPTIDSEGNYNIIVNNSDYAYFMFVRAYQRLRESYAYRVSVNGVVTPQTSLAGKQKVGMTYKKVGDERLYENLNFGNGAAGVEPKVSVLTYTNFKTKKVKYEMVKGDSNVKDNLTANYSCNFTETDYQGYQSKFGISPEGFFPYNITNDTIKLGTMSNLSYNNNQYQFTVQFGTGKSSPANDLVIANYRTLMNEMVKGQSIKQYNYIKLTFVFDEFGNIKTFSTNEQYVVVAPIVGDIDTNGEITYIYTTSNDESINKIDISSNSAIRNTINETLPQETKNTIETINTYILNKRRELV